MWQKCSLGQTDNESCDGPATPYNWTDAFTAIAALNAAQYDGYSDWRLPNATELMSIVDYGTGYPAINGEAFPNTQSACYWSSSTDASSPGFKRIVTFDDGSIGNTGSGICPNPDINTLYVRCVRGPGP